MTKNRRYLFRNNGNFAYNYKLKKYEHISQTPMRGDFYYLQSTKKTYLSMSLNKKYFIYYCCITIKKFSQSANTVIVWLKLKKLLKKMLLFVICVLNCYKIKTKSTLKYILYGQKTKNIGFSQTFIILFWIICLEEKISRQMWQSFTRTYWILLKLLNIRYQGEPLGCNALTLPS